MSGSTGDRWFKIFTLIGTGFGAGFSIANAIYYNRIRTGTCNAVTRGEATTLMWINIVMAVFFIILFFWALYMLLFSSSIRTDLDNQPIRLSGNNAVYRPTQQIYQQPMAAPLAPGQLVTSSGSAAANVIPANVLQNPSAF